MGERDRWDRWIEDTDRERGEREGEIKMGKRKGRQ